MYFRTLDPDVDPHSQYCNDLEEKLLFEQNSMMHTFSPLMIKKTMGWVAKRGMVG
jgi:hypothetical protein